MNKTDNNIVIYQSEDGKVHLDVVYNEETMWLTQQQLCELYQTSKSNVSEHIKHIFEDEELIESSVVRKFRTTATDGKTYEVNHYNLDMILSLGYRVRSVTATRSRLGNSVQQGNSKTHLLCCRNQRLFGFYGIKRC